MKSLFKSGLIQLIIVLLFAPCWADKKKGQEKTNVVDKYAESRIDAVKEFVSFASAKDQEQLKDSFIPFVLIYEITPLNDGTLSDEQKGKIKDEYEQIRDQIIESCIHKLGGHDVKDFSYKDIGLLAFSENELGELKESEKKDLGSNHGDVQVATAKGTFNFRLLHYQGKWLFTSFR